jgi:hypothetical protein
MSWIYREPTLDEILSDPIVTALMQADSVDRRELRAMLRHVAEGLRPNEQESDTAHSRGAVGAAARRERSAVRECWC